MNMLTIEKVIRNWAEETTIDFDDKRNICCYSFQYDEKFFPKLLRKITKTPHKEKDKKTLVLHVNRPGYFIGKAGNLINKYKKIILDNYDRLQIDDVVIKLAESPYF